MLTEVCDFVHNYFELALHSGEFEITDGSISLDFLQDGQRFQIRGSAVNDGIYTYHADQNAPKIYNDDDTEPLVLKDETFNGVIAAMGVPVALLSVVYDINAWIAKNKDVLESPYTSESFGGYSYTKASGSGANAGGSLGWQDMFRSRLNAYRKIS